MSVIRIPAGSGGISTNTRMHSTRRFTVQLRRFRRCNRAHTASRGGGTGGRKDRFGPLSQSPHHKCPDFSCGGHTVSSEPLPNNNNKGRSGTLNTTGSSSSDLLRTDCTVSHSPHIPSSEKVSETASVTGRPSRLTPRPRNTRWPAATTVASRHSVPVFPPSIALHQSHSLYPIQKPLRIDPSQVPFRLLPFCC